MHPYCKACVREYCKARYATHTEQIKATVRDYRIRNAESIKERDRVRYQANRAKYAPRVARYYQENRERLLVKARAYRKALDMDVERAHKRAYRRANRDLTREWEHRRRAQERGTTVIPLTRAMIDAKVNYWGRKCWVCSGPFEAIDHVKPLSKGGSHILANLRPICGSCNSKKHSTWPYAPLRSTA